MSLGREMRGNSKRTQAQLLSRLDKKKFSLENH